MEFATALFCSQEVILKAVLREANLICTHKPTLMLKYFNIIFQYTHMLPKLCLSLELSDKNLHTFLICACVIYISLNSSSFICSA
jgi:hypothetical protein